MSDRRAPAHARMTRRQSLVTVFTSFASVGAWSVIGTSIGCSPSSSRDGAGRIEPRVDEDLLDDDVTFEDAVDAAFETILPAERDADGKLTVPGAREAGAGRVLETEGFGLYALAQGFVPRVADRAIALIEQTGPSVRAAINVELDLLASAKRPLVAFKDLPAKLREEIIDAALDDGENARAGAMQLVRAACFTAWLGAVTSDVGLRAVGFPQFEDFDAGLAVSGYPRTKAGRKLDASKDDLALLASKGELDDYTFNLAPAVTPGDDLSAIMDAAGDLV